MAVEANTARTLLPPPPRVSASSVSSAPTVGDLLTRVSNAVTTNSGASRHRECSSPRSSLLSRILHRRSRSVGFSCRLRLSLPRYCSSGVAKEDSVASADEAAAAPKVVGRRAEPPRDSPRRSLAEKKAPAPAPAADDALPASLGLGASLVLLLSKSAAELSRMAELRAQMERLMTDVRADVRSCNGRPSASDGHTDSASVFKESIVCVGDQEGALSHSRGQRTGDALASIGAHSGSRTGAPASDGGSGNAGIRDEMDQMEAELESELSRLQADEASNDEESVTPQQDHVAEADAKSGDTSGIHSACSDSGIEDADLDQDEEEEEDDEDDDEREESPTHGGVPARELERRLHELLQSRHEARIAELESALERARRKLKEKEREACRWRDAAKLASRFTDESRLR